MPTWISCLARSPTFTLPSRVRQHYGFQCLEPISSTLRTFNSEQMSTRRIYSSNSWPSSKTTCYLLTVAYNPPWGSCGCRWRSFPITWKHYRFSATTVQLSNQGLPLLVKQKCGSEDPCLSQAKDFSGSQFSPQWAMLHRRHQNHAC